MQLEEENTDLSADLHDGSKAQTEQGQQQMSRYPRLGNGASTVSPYYFQIGSVDQFESQLEAAQRDLGIPARDFIPVQYVDETNWMMEVLKLAPTLLLIGFMVMMMRGAGGGAGGGMGNMFKVGKSNAKKIKSEEVGVTFKDVAGVDEAKREIMEFVQFLKNPDRFTKLGAKIPKGAILVGPPGTGKTLLAKATAGEASVPFYSTSGSDFIEMFVGVGPSRVRDLFKEARANQPCIVFIDEIDAVARARGKGGFSGGNDERENTLNQLLVEMDGFNTSAGVVVLAGTNRVDILDQAILRPGRFDRQITVGKPDIKGRQEIFQVHMKGLKLDGDIDDVSRKLAALTPGFAGAEIANICNEAAIQAARADKESVDLECFEKATDRVIGGLETGKVISKEELRTVAYHEAGHAVAGWFLENADPILKVTIVPRGNGALGFAQDLPKEVSLHTTEELRDTICMALGGRAAESLHFGKVTTGASDDLNRVTKMAYQMVQVFGMNDRIGTLSFPPDNSGGFPQRMYSESTAEAIDEEAKRLVDDMYERTKALLDEKQDAVVALAERLLEVETINHDEIVRLIGARPFDGSDEYRDYVASKAEFDGDGDGEAEEGADGAGDDDAEPQLTPTLACKADTNEQR
jgi:AFG3 family protein